MAVTNVLNLPQPFVDAVRSSYRPKPNRYSVTRVLGGTCEAVLLRRHHDELGGDVSDRVWAILGSAVHKILEQSEETDSQLKENWLSVQVGDYELSGIFDLYDAATKTVTDYKTCGTIKWQKKEFDDYRKQTLLYCLLLRGNGFDAEHGEVVMLLRDWSKSKARFDSDYPKCQVQKVHFDFTDKDFAWAHDYVDGWFKRVRVQEARPDGEIEPCSPSERWHKDDKWAVKKKGRKTALRVLDSLDAAVSWANAKGIDLDEGTHSIEFRQGEDTKCALYCGVTAWCPYAASMGYNTQ